MKFDSIRSRQADRARPTNGAAPSVKSAQVFAKLLQAETLRSGLGALAGAGAGDGSPAASSPFAAMGKGGGLAQALLQGWGGGSPTALGGLPLAGLRPEVLAPAAFARTAGGAAAAGTPAMKSTAPAVPAATAPVRATRQPDTPPAEAPSNLPYGDYIAEAAAKYGVPASLVSAVIKAESGFNPKAHSPAGAIGLMQLMPGTAAGMGIADPWDPAQNIDGGVRYLANALRRYDGDVRNVLQAYNAGGGAVAKYNGDVPYEETRRYVRNVMAAYDGYKAVWNE